MLYKCGKYTKVGPASSNHTQIPIFVPPSSQAIKTRMHVHTCKGMRKGDLSMPAKVMFQTDYGF